MKIAFLLDSVVISGGINVVFEYATRLQELGHSSTMIMHNKLSLERKELDWFPKSNKLVWRTYDELSKDEYFDIVIATWWKTFYDLHRVNAKHYVYFVQSIESRFYDVEEKTLRKLVESTYMLNLPIITEAKWIKEYLEYNYQANVQLVRNGINKDVFRPDGACIQARDPNKLRVLVEGPLKVPFKNVPTTIRLCKESKADEIWLLTSTPIKTVQGIDRVFSQIPIEKTAEVYRSCDVIIKLSYVEGMFGPPLEIFHCGGTAITYDVTGYDEYLIHEENSLIAKTADEQTVILYINQLKDNKDMVENLKRGALKTAITWNGWDKSVRDFETALLNIMNLPEIKISTFKMQSEFLYDWYLLADKYRTMHFDPLSRIKENLKAYLKISYPKTFSTLKQLRGRLR